MGTDKRNTVVATPTFGDITIYLARDPVDFRLGINGLSTMVEATVKFDPFSRNLFCFATSSVKLVVVRLILPLEVVRPEVWLSSQNEGHDAEVEAHAGRDRREAAAGRCSDSARQIRC
jgi:hypothetical protein